MSIDITAEVRAEIDRTGLTQKDIAKKAGLPESVLSRALNSRRAFPMAHLLSVAAALNVPASELIRRAETAQKH